MVQRSQESFKPRRMFGIYFWYYRCVICFLWKVTSSNPALGFQSVPKGTISSSAPFYLWHGQGQPFKTLAKLFLKVTKDLLSLLSFIYAFLIFCDVEGKYKIESTVLCLQQKNFF